MPRLSKTQQARVAGLLASMTRTEKLAQLQVTFRMDAGENADLARAGIGALFWPMSAAAANELQRVAVEESAHGIPLLIGLDVIHGHRTIFPIPLAQACSFDAEVAAAQKALEIAPTGGDWELGANIAYIQYLQLAIPRQFLPQVGYSEVDLSLMHLLNDADALAKLRAAVQH